MYRSRPDIGEILPLRQRKSNAMISLCDSRFTHAAVHLIVNHYVNVSVLIKISQKTNIQNILFYGEISKNINFYHFYSNPRFPPLLRYVRCKSGVTFVRRRFRDGFQYSNRVLGTGCTGSKKKWRCFFGKGAVQYEAKTSVKLKGSIKKRKARAKGSSSKSLL